MDGRLPSATRHIHRQRHIAANPQGHIRRALQHGIQHAQIMRNGIEAAAIDDLGARVAGHRVVALQAQLDKFRLAGQVQIMRAGLGAGFNQRLAVVNVRPHRRDHRPGRRRHGGQRFRIVHIGLHQPQRVAGGRQLGQAALHIGQLAHAAPGQRPAQRVRRMARQVLRREAAGKPGGAKQNQVIHGLRHAAVPAVWLGSDRPDYRARAATLVRLRSPSALQRLRRCGA